MLTSQALVLATAMAASAGTIIIFNLFHEKHSLSSTIPTNQDSHFRGKKAPKSCLSSGGKRRIKRVRFADDVKDSRGDLCVKLHRREEEKNGVGIEISSCGEEVLGLRGMPANRVALYSGILRDRVQRMGYSY